MNRDNGNGHLLQIAGLAKSYGGRSVVDAVHLSVRRGEIVGLLGPNGAGKTTCFYMVVGLIPPEGGRIRFKGGDVTHLPMHLRARTGIGYLSQEPSIFRKLTVEENILAILETLPLTGRDRGQRLVSLLDELGISHLAKSRADTLSGGERRRLEITRALATEPTLLLLDEPFSGIDPIAVAECQEIIRGLKERGLGILLTDHNVRETLSITDRSYLMADGKVLIEGQADELLGDAKAREIYLGPKFRM
ncbi:MAG: LPS export ABC transporter ATP-binding protein [Candidatus Omnitrophica bacterium]|nr:LPS export ABC transporter ATP-binding protein [Candidatus Omnitrophota bacterium]